MKMPAVLMKTFMTILVKVTVLMMMLMKMMVMKKKKMMPMI